MPAKAKKPAKPAMKSSKVASKPAAKTKKPAAKNPAKPGKPAPKPSKPAPKTSKLPAKKAPAKTSKPTAAAPKPAAKTTHKPSPSSKTSKASPHVSAKTKTTPPPAKTILKKKPAASAADKPSVRRTRGKDTPTSTKKFVPTIAISKGPIRPTVPKEDWTPPPDMPWASFIKRQKVRLLELRDTMMDSLNGVAQETLRMRAEGSEASAFGMHQADAGSDAYDRDFALSLLAKEQDALYEIDEALKRLVDGTYGTCEMSSKRIPQPRLEALPFARFTIECQQEYEKETPNGGRRQVRSLFGLMGSEDEDEEGEEGEKETVDKSED